MKTFFLSLLSALSSLHSLASIDSVKIPMGQQLFYRRVDEAQLEADKLDYKADHFLKLTGNDEINLQITDAIFRRIDEMQYDCVVNKRFEANNNKVNGALRLLRNVVIAFSSAYRQKKINAVYAPELIDCFEKSFHASLDSQSIAPFINEVHYETGNIILDMFPENSGYAASKKILFLKYINMHPEKTLQLIGPYADEPFADSLVVLACLRNPVQLYNYAQKTNSPEGRLIHRSTNPMVKAVADLSLTPNALFYFPFLDDLLKGKKTIDDIKKYVGDGEEGYDSVGYYKLLVKTEIDYYNRVAVLKDTPVAMYGSNSLTETLQKKSWQHFVKHMNELHEVTNPNIRFRSVDQLGPTELYYLMVLTEEDIYTSTFKNCFERMMDRLGKKPKTDSLLLAVNFDHYKKFIKMSAGYNKLDTFLKAMPKENADNLMRAFTKNLEKSSNNEEAVDVADSYSSVLNNKPLSSFILNQLKENERRCIAAGDQKGTVLYQVLKNICLSATDSTINLTQLYGIPSVYSLEYNALADDSGRVIEQNFFYGDEDGRAYYPLFVNSFPASVWKRTENKEWIEFSSIKGKPVWVFANKPLDNDSGQDSVAQADLTEYLQEKDWAPNVFVHRGHSYWLPYTLDQLQPSGKIIILGSCGGYKNLSRVLETCPDAHIISTKQIGKGDMNQKIINYVNAELIKGKKLDWRQMWDNMTKDFAKDPNKEVRDTWLDYIPPHKNLGALFIKAYTKKLEGE
ncbi:MAG: hypothetical protein ABJA78_14075 [Ferruginibacter sp.]